MLINQYEQLNGGKRRNLKTSQKLLPFFNKQGYYPLNELV